jgi:hypothetical protein
MNFKKTKTFGLMCCLEQLVKITGTIHRVSAIHLNIEWFWIWKPATAKSRLWPRAGYGQEPATAKSRLPGSIIAFLQYHICCTLCTLYFLLNCFSDNFPTRPAPRRPVQIVNFCAHFCMCCGASLKKWAQKLTIFERAGAGSESYLKSSLVRALCYVCWVEPWCWWCDFLWNGGCC